MMWPMAAVIIVALAFIIIVRAVWGRANPGARLAAIGAALFATWLLLAAVNPHAASVVTDGTASGAVGLVRGLGTWIGQF